MMNFSQAILDKDFDKLALATMQDSNQFHAVCLDTYPPIFYLNETSQSIIRLVHLYNQHYGKVKVTQASRFKHDKNTPPEHLVRCAFTGRLHVRRRPERGAHYSGQRLVRPCQHPTAAIFHLHGGRLLQRNLSDHCR